jgi:hypothetical protein
MSENSHYFGQNVAIMDPAKKSPISDEGVTEKGVLVVYDGNSL